MDLDRLPSSPSPLDLAALLDSPPRPSAEAAIALGESREGRPILGYRAGSGPRPVSLVAGCHADEPVGPAMLDRLAAHLLARHDDDPDDPLLRAFRFHLVPHPNPDGEARNAAWTDALGDPATWTDASRDVRVDLESYLRHVVRETPGDDLEFGFPRGPSDADARPEARAVAQFLRAGLAPGEGYALHGSFHGMAFAAGPWFLLEAAWMKRSESMRERLRAAVEVAGYPVHDIDRGGDKGFHRIDRGFTTRPDSRAMVAHFASRGDSAMAARFRPSSMEFVRHLGGDPLTIVSEMPLFLLPPAAFDAEDPVRPPAVREVQAAVGDAEALAEVVRRHALVSMPIRDQVIFQLLFLGEALACVLEAERREDTL